MPNRNKIQGAGRRFTDGIVNFLSGRTPAPGFDGPAAFGTAALIGVAAFGIGGWLIWHTINDVGQSPPLNNNTSQATAIVELEKLRSLDTDEDELSDYDELYSYHTSPYLKDSDSDTVNDSDEIRRGTDPNCPSGRSCTGFSPGATTTGEGQLSTDFLRQALRAAGVAQSVLDGLSDDQLLKVYQEVVAEAASVNGNINGTAAEAAPTLAELENLSGDEIRQLLESAGVSKSELDKYDDATLKQVFNEAIQS